ncbi:MAG: hypothetical protein HC803_09355 [Saprospiraceae bacterium]|nr:hypothetical protein [Saprospiraceae bacterium]
MLLLAANTPVLAATSERNTLNSTVSFEVRHFPKSSIDSSKTVEKMDFKKWLPLGLGVLGIALIFIPYLSIIGLIAGVLAIVSGFLFRKKYPKTARWGIWLGGFCVVAFLGVLGLILFF